MVMGENTVLELKVTRAQAALARAKARLLKSKSVNIKTLKVVSATQKIVKSGRPAWGGRVTDPKTGIVYQVSAVAVPEKSQS